MNTDTDVYKLNWRVTAIFRALAAGAVALLAQNAHGQTTIYNNTLGFNGNFNYNNEEAGNEIVLSGSAATDYIGKFQFQFDLTGTGTPTGSPAVELNLYQNNGPLVAGYSSPGATPIYSSGFSTLSSIGLTTFTTGQTLTYDPNVVVPKDFTWTVTFENVPTGETAGLALDSQPTGPSVGGNYGDAWVNPTPGNDSTWTLEIAGTGNPSLQFAAIVATPEPSTLMLGVVGAFAFLARRRKG